MYVIVKPIELNQWNQNKDFKGFKFEDFAFVYDLRFEYIDYFMQINHVDIIIIFSCFQRRLTKYQGRRHLHIRIPSENNLYRGLWIWWTFRWW